MLLVESLDAAGSDRADARDRCAALRSLGAVVRVAVIHTEGGHSGVGSDQVNASPGALAEWSACSFGFDQLGEFAREGHFDLILVAGAVSGGGPVARALKGQVPVFWWPTGLAPASGWGARWRFGRHAPLPPITGGTCGVPCDVPPGLAWSSVGARPAGRSRLTLWDGEYLLSPLPLAGEDGNRLLAAFAALAEEWCALDLVVLAAPQPAFERKARALGIGPRVHFVGSAPREAEWAWWAGARGAVIGGEGTISGGLVLRGLETGCPLMVLRSDPTGVAIATWLERHLGRLMSPAREGAAAALAQLLERGPAIEDLRARGRVLAAEHYWSRLGPRLVDALPMLVRAVPGRPRPAKVA